MALVRKKLIKSGKDISIQDYFHNTYSKEPGGKERTLQLRLIPFGILQLIVCYVSKRGLEEGVIYMDFDTLDSISNDKYKEHRKKLYCRDDE
ncbi:hypothetical protein IHO40_00495 [Wolbachia endosymbiont of Mansonella ozzardi]|uniref:hypothetical protein n=1 Tax=Wolbachia endosymbiont of Mansonella ozzardi TaxID=137464 RepID=UPI001CE13E45|nr:hypothetical protein [Wolbachia endosymbiont of Mansonella ozzardi]MCA4774666.1 hypothetical protein [Wolbachia endosymbiont of Mansonella ozzardi]